MTKKKLEEILKQIKDDEDSIKTYINTFSKSLKKLKQNEIIDIDKLNKLFNNFIQKIYLPSETCKFLENQLKLTDTLLTDTLTKDQRRLYDILTFLNIEYSADYAHKAFLYGYCLASEIKNEIESVKDNVE